MKLIIDGETYCYGQFVGNPGGLWLARMAPENIRVPSTEPYSEELLLQDALAALEKAKDLTHASVNWDIAHDFYAIRTDYQPRGDRKPGSSGVPAPPAEPVAADDQKTTWFVAAGVAVACALLIAGVAVWKLVRSRRVRR